MSDIDRKEHLERLLGYIDDRSRFTLYNFELLLTKLKDEASKEIKRLDDPKKNHYLNNLQQTIDKQADDFKTAKEKDRPTEYSYFIEAFKQDIDEELTRIKYPPPTSGTSGK